MTGELDRDPDFLDEEEAPLPARDVAQPSPTALVIEDEPRLTKICTTVLSRVGIRVEVCATRETALAALAREDGRLAFVYADARLVAATCDAAASQVRSFRPETPFVLASREIGDVLTCDAVVVCEAFDQDQFQAAFDAALFDEESRRLLLDAAEAVRAFDAAEAAAVAAAPPATEPVASPEMPLPLSA